MRPEPNIYTGKWVKVDYDRDAQHKKCWAILDSVLPIFDDADTARAIATVGSHGVLGHSAIRTIISDILLEEIVGFKNKAFEVEKEWRIVVRQRELLKQGTDDTGKASPPVYFRSSKGMLVPTKPDEGLPIVCVRTGPTLDKTTAGMAVRMLLDDNGFCNVNVERFCLYTGPQNSAIL